VKAQLGAVRTAALLTVDDSGGRARDAIFAPHRRWRTSVATQCDASRSMIAADSERSATSPSAPRLSCVSTMVTAT
jgi:hypothetical protein